MANLTMAKGGGPTRNASARRKGIKPHRLSLSLVFCPISCTTTPDISEGVRVRSGRVSATPPPGQSSRAPTPAIRRSYSPSGWPVVPTKHFDDLLPAGRSHRGSRVSELGNYSCLQQCLQRGERVLPRFSPHRLQPPSA